MGEKLERHRNEMREKLGMKPKYYRERHFKKPKKRS